MAALSEAIGLHLAKEGLSQQSVADRCKLSYEQVNDLARGQGNPTFNTLTELCEGLGVTIGQLMTSVDACRRNRGDVV
jgi:transcriptional regulator with XRE-family HTH domain